MVEDGRCERSSLAGMDAGEAGQGWPRAAVSASSTALSRDTGGDICRATSPLLSQQSARTTPAIGTIEASPLRSLNLPERRDECDRGCALGHL
jgi:hypothetical protein